MGKNPNTFAKRQREMEKKRKADEKRKRRQERKDNPDSIEDESLEVDANGDLVPSGTAGKIVSNDADEPSSSV